MSTQSKIVNLWFLFILGGLIHTVVELLPLFFMPSIVIEGASTDGIAVATWFSIVMYLIPMTLILAIQLTEATWLRLVNLVVAVAALLLSAMHPMELFEAEELNVAQLLLMSFIVLSMIVLVAQSWCWFRPKTSE